MQETATRESRERIRREIDRAGILPENSSTIAARNLRDFAIQAMHTFQLQPHPSTPCSWIDSLSVTVSRDPQSRVSCRYELRGETDRLLIPSKSSTPTRMDELWKHTCFEIFLRSARNEYAELNLSPSGNWAAYGFDDYRSGMTELALISPPAITAEISPRILALTATFVHSLAWDPTRIALSSVLEDRDGRIAYWALRHADGKPDFHHEAGFVEFAV